jgi:hypothetical protein
MLHSSTSFLFNFLNPSSPPHLSSAFSSLLHLIAVDDHLVKRDTSVDVFSDDEIAQLLEEEHCQVVCDYLIVVTMANNDTVAVLHWRSGGFVGTTYAAAGVRMVSREAGD